MGQSIQHEYHIISRIQSYQAKANSEKKNYPINRSSIIFMISKTGKTCLLWLYPQPRMQQSIFPASIDGTGDGAVGGL